MEPTFAAKTGNGRLKNFKSIVQSIDNKELIHDHICSSTLSRILCLQLIGVSLCFSKSNETF